MAICRLELLELDVRTVVRVDRELELGIDRLDVGENGLRFGLGGSDVFRRRGPRRTCGQRDERRRRYDGESLQVPSHAALFRRTTLEHLNCPHNAGQISSRVITGQMAMRILALNRRDVTRRNLREI